MKRYLPLILTMGMLAPGSTLPAQDFESDYRQFYDRLAGVEKLHIHMDVVVYESKDKAEKLDSYSISLKKSGDHFLYDLGESKMLLSPDTLITVDDKDKTIVVKRRVGDEKMKFDQLYNPVAGDEPGALEEFFSVIDSVEAQSDHAYILSVSKMQPIEKIEIEFTGSENGGLKSMKYHYGAGPYSAYVEIQFERFDPAPGFSTKEFSTSQFLTWEEGDCVPRGDYKHYELQNQ